MSEKYYSLTQLKSITRTEGNQWTGPYGRIHPDDLKKLKPADVRPVVPAKWIALDIYRGMENYKCSACNQECYVPECMGEPMYLYCPNCGAYMRPDTTDN